MVFTLDQAYNWMAIIVFILRSIRNDATLHGWMDFVTKSITWRWGSNITMSYYGTECPNLKHSGPQQGKFALGAEHKNGPHPASHK